MKLQLSRIAEGIGHSRVYRHNRCNGLSKEDSEADRGKKADYLPMVKDNQKGLKEEIENLYKITAAASKDMQSDVGHGRVEARSCEVIDGFTFMDGPGKWHRLKSIVKIQSGHYNKKRGEHLTKLGIISVHCPLMLFILIMPSGGTGQLKITCIGF